MTALLLFAGGVAAAATLGRGTSPAGQTLTLTITDDTTTATATTITVARPTTGSVSPAATAALRAALADPTRIAGVVDPRTRRLLRAQLASLDEFLADRPKLRPYRAHLWYVAHHARPSLAPRRLAALLWCTVWFPHDCG